MSHHGALLKDQIHDRYASMFERGVGRSKREWVAEHGNTRGMIFSRKTFQVYKEVGRNFCKWMREEHRDVKRLDDCEQYVNEYLAKRIYTDQVSASTIKRDKSALAKLFARDGMTDQERGWMATPERKREDITRSRRPVEYDRHFAEHAHADEVEVWRSIGLRRSELEAVRGNQLRCEGDVMRWVTYDGHGGQTWHERTLQRGEMYLENVVGKGGRSRCVEVVGDKELVRQTFEQAGSERVFGKVYRAADVHSYRADYAARVYEVHARPVDEIPRRERYWCQGDKAGTCYDRRALAEVSRNLGHSRIDVCAEHYLWR